MLWELGHDHNKFGHEVKEKQFFDLSTCVSIELLWLRQQNVPLLQGTNEGSCHISWPRFPGGPRDRLHSEWSGTRVRGRAAAQRILPCWGICLSSNRNEGKIHMHPLPCQFGFPNPDPMQSRQTQVYMVHRLWRPKDAFLKRRISVLRSTNAFNRLWRYLKLNVKLNAFTPMSW